jgi:hypothetical protein
MEREALNLSKHRKNGDAPQSPVEQNIPDAVRYNMIAEAAYYRAEKRGFQNGDPIEDWVAAEEEIHEKLAQPAPSAIVLGLDNEW